MKSQRQQRKILVVVDDLNCRELLSAALQQEYELKVALGQEEALQIAATWLPDVVLLEPATTGPGGYVYCRRLKKLSTRRGPQVIVVSGSNSKVELARSFEFGADDYLVKPIDADQLRSRLALHSRLQQRQAEVEALRGQIDSYHAGIRRQVFPRDEEFVTVQDVTVLTLAKVAESRDAETGEHLIRLREYAQLLACDLDQNSPYANQIDEAFLADLYRSSPLHDIGKVGIADAILRKPGRLTSEEFEQIKRHTVIGSNILHEAVMHTHGGSCLSMASMIAQFHHERWDGSGYPAGLIGEEIPLSARIVAVADVYDALTSERPYKDAWSPECTRQTIEEASGTQFDPLVVEAFSRCFPDFLIVQRQHADKEPMAVGAMTFLEYDLLEAVV